MKGTILLAIEQGGEALRLTKHQGGYITLTLGRRLMGRWEHAEKAAALSAFHEQAECFRALAVV